MEFKIGDKVGIKYWGQLHLNAITIAKNMRLRYFIEGWEPEDYIDNNKPYETYKEYTGTIVQIFGDFHGIRLDIGRDIIIGSRDLKKVVNILDINKDMFKL